MKIDQDITCTLRFAQEAVLLSAKNETNFSPSSKANTLNIVVAPKLFTKRSNPWERSVKVELPL